MVCPKEGSVLKVDQECQSREKEKRYAYSVECAAVCGNPYCNKPLFPPLFSDISVPFSSQTIRFALLFLTLSNATGPKA